MTDAQKKKYPINKPDTKFAMKANLVQNEPASLKRWEAMKLYEQIRNAPHPKGKFAFHDGPPYANGSIHLGHLLNKALKDIVVRSRTMMGFDVDYVPGWDCHGLPIEHKVMQELGDKAHGMAPMQIRKRCKDYAEKFVKLQSGQMKRLLTLARYDEPYLTMQPEFEAATLEVFADLVSKALVDRALKPVHWSIANQTALAEAELEYYDREDTSVYVLFEVVNPAVLSSSARPKNIPSDAPIYLLIWTTTPWTLPANLAVAVSFGDIYQLRRFELGGKSGYAIIEQQSSTRLEALAGIKFAKEVAVWGGAELARSGVRYQHPFVDRISPVVVADYVTNQDGTGLVHTAPGHGVEDYQTGLRTRLHFEKDGREVCVVDSSKYGLQSKQPDPDIYCPVKEDGTFDATAPDWLQGKDVWSANGLVVNKLRDSGHLFHAHKFTHSYPHDWRSKTPVIFRATEQWFISVDRLIGNHMWVPKPHLSSQLSKNEGQKLRERALESLKNISFIPAWGINRLKGMLESRPDWCISRQRAWGLPIPVFYLENDTPLYSKNIALCVADKIRRSPDGSNCWYTASVEELLEGYDPAQDPQVPQHITRSDIPSLTKGTDIFDVWFESGSSWRACMVQRDLARKDGALTDLYLEGSDQHRGWFQVSLLTSLATTGRPAFTTVLTHGFMVDKDGRKMSKSLGNALEVDTLLKDYGADVCRWWVATLNTDNDIKVDPEFFRLAGEEYRKVRNTIRYLLSNLADYQPSSGNLLPGASIDAWAMGELNKVIARVTKGYESFNFRQVSEALFDFCNDTLSAVYLAAVKDRLYCDAPGPAPGSERRRRTQFVMHTMADALIRMIAPILPHTADEAWASLHKEEGVEASVHLAFLPPEVECDASDAWPAAMEVRGDVLRAMEDAKMQRGIENPLDMGVTAAIPPEVFAQLKEIEPEMADLCGVSRFVFVENGELTIEVEDLRGEPRCDRSWKRDGTVKLRSDGGMLTDRDAAAVGVG